MDQDVTALDAAHHEIFGHQLRDERGEVIGVVEDVIFDERTGEPRYLVVHPKGWIHAILHDDHYVPAHRTHWEGDAVVTPFDRDEVLHAPGAPFKNHVVDTDTEHKIEEHYHLTT